MFNTQWLKYVHYQRFKHREILEHEGYVKQI